MARELMCDICKKPTQRIVTKLLLLSIKDGEKWRRNDYVAHADVGDCCAQKILKEEFVKWAPRKKRTKAA